MKKGNIFWGVILILIALYIVLGAIFGRPTIGLFSLIISVALVAIIIQSIPQRNFWGILLPLAILCIMYSDELHLNAITPWPVIWGAIFGSIGLSIIFGDKHHHRNDGYYSNGGNPGGGAQAGGPQWNQAGDGTGAQDTNGQNQSGTYQQYNQTQGNGFYENMNNQPDPSFIDYRVKFATCVKYINCDDFKQADLSCSFGTMKVYFDHAFISGSQAEIYVSASFSTVELYIPKEWKVRQDIAKAFGGVDEKFRPSEPGAGPVVTVRGNINFAGVTIIYI